MAKRKTQWTEEKIAKYINEGRGRGELDTYKPWLTTQDFSSEGKTHRLKSWKTNRMMQLFSNLEYGYMLILDWSDNVYDIREQFPLEREVTIKVADTLNIKHSTDKETGTPIVMTTDFLITLRTENGFKYFARSIKPSEKLQSKHVLEKLEIERQYWENQNISWGIVTEKDIPKSLRENIEFIHQSYYLEEEYLILSDLLYDELQSSNGMILRALDFFERKYKLENGLGLQIFKYLLAKKVVIQDMKEAINLRQDISHLTFKKNIEQEKIS